MALYQVEVMKNDQVEATLAVEAATPYGAAVRALPASIIHYKIEDRARWIRVSLPGKGCPRIWLRVRRRASAHHKLRDTRYRNSCLCFETRRATRVRRSNRNGTERLKEKIMLSPNREKAMSFEKYEPIQLTTIVGAIEDFCRHNGISAKSPERSEAATFALSFFNSGIVSHGGLYQALNTTRLRRKVN